MEPQSELPGQIASVPPPTDMNSGAGQVRFIISALQESVKEIRGDLKESIKEIKADVKENVAGRHSDFVYFISVFGGGFLLLAGMVIFSHFRVDDKILGLQNKIQGLEVSSEKVNAKLEVLLQRLPQAQPSIKRN